MSKELGTVVAYGKEGERVELAITSYLRATYKDHRLISMAQLEDNTYVLSIENPESSGRAISQRMRLTPESLIGLLSTSTLYFDTMGINLENMLKEAVRESGNIDFSFDRLENYEGAEKHKATAKIIWKESQVSEDLQTTRDESVCCIDEKECFYPHCDCAKRAAPLKWSVGQWGWSEDSKTMLSFINNLSDNDRIANVDNQDGIKEVWATDIMVKPTDEEIFNTLKTIAENKYPVGTQVRLMYSDVREAIESSDFVYSDGKLYADGGRLAVWDNGNWAEVVKDTPAAWDVTVDEFKMIDYDGVFTITIRQEGLTNPSAQKIADKIRDFLNK